MIKTRLCDNDKGTEKPSFDLMFFFVFTQITAKVHEIVRSVIFRISRKFSGIDDNKFDAVIHLICGWMPYYKTN